MLIKRKQYIGIAIEQNWVTAIKLWSNADNYVIKSMTHVPLSVASNETNIGHALKTIRHKLRYRHGAVSVNIDRSQVLVTELILDSHLSEIDIYRYLCQNTEKMAGKTQETLYLDYYSLGTSQHANKIRAIAAIEPAISKLLKNLNQHDFKVKSITIDALVLGRILPHLDMPLNDNVGLIYQHNNELLFCVLNKANLQYFQTHSINPQDHNHVDTLSDYILHAYNSYQQAQTHSPLKQIILLNNTIVMKQLTKLNAIADVTLQIATFKPKLFSLQQTTNLNILALCLATPPIIHDGNLLPWRQKLYRRKNLRHYLAMLTISLFILIGLFSYIISLKRIIHHNHETNLILNKKQLHLQKIVSQSSNKAATYYPIIDKTKMRNKKILATIDQLSQIMPANCEFVKLTIDPKLLIATGRADSEKTVINFYEKINHQQLFTEFSKLITQQKNHDTLFKFTAKLER